MTEGFAILPSVKLWYWDTGGSREAIILCHPGSQSCRIWEHQRDAFTAAGYRVLAYSRRGHYRSGTGPDESPGTGVGDLLAFMDEREIERAHVLGAAAGGITALALAVGAPQRLRKLVLAGTIFAPQEDEWRQMYARLATAKLQQGVPVELIELGPSYRALQPDGTARFVALAGQSRPHASRGQPVGVAVTWNALEHMQVPTLLLAGEADLYSPPPLQALVGGHIPNKRSVTLPGIGHAPYWEAPSQFNAMVLEFLREPV